MELRRAWAGASGLLLATLAWAFPIPADGPAAFVRDEGSDSILTLGDAPESFGGGLHLLPPTLLGGLPDIEGFFGMPMTLGDAGLWLVASDPESNRATEPSALALAALGLLALAASRKRPTDRE